MDEISKLKNDKTGVKRVMHQLICNLLDTLGRKPTQGIPSPGSLLQSSQNHPVVSHIGTDSVPSIQSEVQPQESSSNVEAESIVSRVVVEGKGSRALLLSAMPCEKPQHFGSLCQILGLTTDKQLYKYNNSSKIYEFLGYSDIVNWCYRHNDEATSRVLHNYDVVSKRTIPLIIMDLYDGVIRDTLSSCVPAERIPVDCIKNGFYALSEEDIDLVKKCQTKLTKLAAPVVASPRGIGEEDAGNIISILNQRKSNWSQITQTLKLLGQAKLRRVYMLAKEDLDSDPHRKVIIGVWYIDHIMWLLDAFRAYKPQVIYGDISKQDRKMIINQFQKPNLVIRVLIINPTVVGMCVPLDDQYGDFPRSEYIFPDYRISEIVQTTGRVLRETTKSVAKTKIRMVYATQFKEEIKIVMASIAKSINARRAITGKSGLLLPNEYEVEHQDTYIAPSYPLPKLVMISDWPHKDRKYDVWQ